ncbi:hypothetical protein V7968_25940 [Nocardia vulneris]|uniref:hypothetical protein n=1 Tax=Nocardia vulneris TaxID=1141657 RepID=UPI0030CB5554
MEDRLTELSDRVQTLTEAVAVLTRGLEYRPDVEPASTRSEIAAQEAHRLLLAEYADEP